MVYVCSHITAVSIGIAVHIITTLRAIVIVSLHWLNQTQSLRGKTVLTKLQDREA